MKIQPGYSVIAGADSLDSRKRRKAQSRNWISSSSQKTMLFISY